MSAFFSQAERSALVKDYAATQAAIDTLISSEEGQDGELTDRFRELGLRLTVIKDQYRAQLPVLSLSRCPFSGAVLPHSFDPFGLDGLWWNYADAVRPRELLPPTFVAMTGAVKLGAHLETIPFLCRPGASVPFVIPSLLGRAEVCAVLSYVPVGNHHGFAILYYARAGRDGISLINGWGMDHDVIEGQPGAEPSAHDADFDLAPWILSGKLRWIAPDDRDQKLQEGLHDCPYLGFAGEGAFYKIYDGKAWPDAPIRQRTVGAASPASSTIACRSCGAPSLASKKFCTACGSPLTGSPAEPGAVRSAPVPGSSAETTTRPREQPVDGTRLPPDPAPQSIAARPTAAPAPEPVHPEGASLAALKLPQGVLKHLFGRVHYAMSEDAARPSLNGVLMVTEPAALKLVATDGAQLALVTFAVRDGLTSPWRGIVPRATVTKLMEMLSDGQDEVAFEMGTASVRFRFAQGVIEAQLVDGTFPDYERVLPRDAGHPVRARRDALLRSLERVVSRTDGSPLIRMAAQGQELCLSGASGEPRAMAEAQCSGPSVQAAFNGQILLRALKSLDAEEIEMAVSSAHAPVRVAIPGRPDFTYLLMPMHAG